MLISGTINNSRILFSLWNVFMCNKLMNAMRFKKMLGLAWYYCVLGTRREGDEVRCNPLHSIQSPELSRIDCALSMWTTVISPITTPTYTPKKDGEKENVGGGGVINRRTIFSLKSWIHIMTCFCISLVLLFLYGYLKTGIFLSQNIFFFSYIKVNNNNTKYSTQFLTCFTMEKIKF